jgi:hypothetical protein
MRANSGYVKFSGVQPKIRGSYANDGELPSKVRRPAYFLRAPPYHTIKEGSLQMLRNGKSST